MDRRSAGVLLGAFLILSVLVIATFFVDFGRQAGLVYILFILELAYLIWAATAKKSLTPLRKIIGIAVLLFFPLLLLAIASFFFELDILEKFAYLLFLVDFLFLLVLFIRKTIRNIASRRVGRPIEVETPFERVTKWVVYAIPVVIFGYVLWLNFNPFDEVIVYDIGGLDDEGILVPKERVSDPMKEGNTTYRNILARFTYFDTLVTPNAKKIIIEINFKNVTEHASLRLGVKDRTLNYIYKDMDYTTKKLEGDWVTVKTEFNVGDLYKNENKVTFMIITAASNTNQIPMNWIDLSIEK